MEKHCGAKIYCSGLSPLLYLLCSGLFERSEIDFITWSSSNDPNEACAIKLKQELAEFLVGYFGHSIRFHGPYSASFQSYGGRFENPKNGRYADYSEPSILLEDRCFLTQNLLSPFRAQLKLIKYGLLPSGSNCFSKLFRLKSYYSIIDGVHEKDQKFSHLPKGDMRKFITHEGKRSLRKFKYSWVNRRVEYFYTLPIHNLEWQREIQDEGLATMMSVDSMLARFRGVAQAVAKEYPGASVENFNDYAFHPMLAAISMRQYRDYAKRIVGACTEKRILLKSHPGSPEDFSEAFSDFDVYKVPKIFSYFPGELIYFQRPTTYVGYLSALLHFVSEKHRVLIEPPEEVRRNYSSQKFDPMLFALNERGLIRTQH